MGPARPRSGGFGAVLRTVVEVRRRTLLPLDDALGCLRETPADSVSPAVLPGLPRLLPTAQGRHRAPLHLSEYDILPVAISLEAGLSLLQSPRQWIGGLVLMCTPRPGSD